MKQKSCGNPPKSVKIRNSNGIVVGCAVRLWEGGGGRTHDPVRGLLDLAARHLSSHLHGGPGTG